MSFHVESFNTIGTLLSVSLYLILSIHCLWYCPSMFKQWRHDVETLFASLDLKRNRPLQRASNAIFWYLLTWISFNINGRVACNSRRRNADVTILAKYILTVIKARSWLGSNCWSLESESWRSSVRNWDVLHWVLHSRQFSGNRSNLIEPFSPTAKHTPNDYLCVLNSSD